MKKAIYVELVGFSDIFHPDFDRSLRERIGEHQSRIYDLRVWEAGLPGAPAKPSISLVAVREGQEWRSLLARVLGCHCQRIALFGSRRSILGLPVLNSIVNLDDLLMLADHSHIQASAPSRPRAYFPDFNCTVPGI